MIARWLLLTLLAWLGWAVLRALGRAANRPGKPRGAPPTAGDGPMVRDRICNTFLPRTSAIAVRRGDQTHWFCSERCRRQFLDRAATG